MTRENNKRNEYLELPNRTQDVKEAPISEAYIQQWFQEEFLCLFYEDLEFREQVLKCLLTGENDQGTIDDPEGAVDGHEGAVDGHEGTLDARKPRRTWFNGMGEAMEISCEENRYLHLCEEKTSSNADPSLGALREAAAGGCDHVTLKNQASNQQLPRSGCLAKMQAPRRPEHFGEEFYSLQMFGSKESGMYKSGALNRGGLHNSEDRLKSSFPSVVKLETEHKILEESATGPCVHERGTQTWKANPLYLLGNSDSESTDSWQQEGPNTAWMDDLDNGNMLQEFKMKKVKRLEEPSLAARKANEYNISGEHCKCDHKKSNSLQGVPQNLPEDKEAADLQQKEGMNRELSRNFSNSGSFGMYAPFLNHVRPDRNDEIAVIVTYNPGKNNGEDLRLHEDNGISNIPSCSESKDCGTSPICNQGDEIGFTSARAFFEARLPCYQDTLLGSSYKRFSQCVVVGLKEDEEVLSRHDLPEISTQTFFPDEKPSPSYSLMGTSTQTNFLNEEASVFQTQVCNFDIKEGLETLANLATNSISLEKKNLKPKEEVVAPISCVSKYVVPDKTKVKENDTQLVGNSSSPQLLVLDAQSTKESHIPLSSVLCDKRGGQRLLESNGGSRQSLNELRISKSISQGQPLLAIPMLSCKYEQICETLSPNEENQGVEEYICSSSKHTKTEFDVGEVSFILPLSQRLASGSITEKEKTRAIANTENVIGEKNVSGPSSPQISWTCCLEAINKEQEHGIDLPKSLCVRKVDPPKPLRNRSMRLHPSIRPMNNIHWLPPKRNIQFMGIHTTSDQDLLEKEKRTSIKWDFSYDNPKARQEEDVIRKDSIKTDSSRSLRNKNQMWASLLSKLFKRTIVTR